MEFRRGGPLDDRRRRVLNSESASTNGEEDGEAATLPTTGSRSQLRAYSPAVLEQHQKRLSDLIPTRPFFLVVLLLLGLTSIAGVEALYTSWVAHASSRYAARLSAIDLQAQGNVGNWLSSMLLAGAALGSLVIYGIRSHRVDDYRGRYRIWLWTAAALIWASLDAATGIHHGVGLIVADLIGAPRMHDLCWLGIYGALSGLLGIRLAMEKWYSLGSFSALGLTALLYIGVALSVLGVVTAKDAMSSVVLQSSVCMLAHLSLCMSIATYARHVRLDAEGKLPQRVGKADAPKKRKSRAKLSVVSANDDSESKGTSLGNGRGKSAKKAAAEDDEEEDDDEDKPQSARQTSAKPAAKPAPLTLGKSSTQAHSSSAKPLPSQASQHQEEDDDEEEESDEDDGNLSASQKLSKAERRRLKKLQRREPQRRAA